MKKKGTLKMDNKAKKPFGWKDNLAYAAGDFGCNMSFALKSTLIIFWTQYMGMDSMLYAALLLIVQVWDAINDPLIGAIIDNDRRKYKRNKFLAYIFAGSIGLIVGGAMCFIPVPNASAMAKNIIFITGYMIWDAFYTIANVPYGSLLSVISEDAGDRASLSAWRNVGFLVAQALTMVLIPILIYDADQNIVGSRVFVTALVMGMIGFAAFRFLIRNTTVRVEGDAAVSEDTPKFNVIRAMGHFLRNRPAVGATVTAMGMFLTLHGSTAAVTVLFQSYFHNVQISGLVSVFAMIPIVCFTPFVRKAVLRFGKKELSVCGALVSIAACILMLILPITSDGKGIVLFTVCQFFNYLGMGVYTVVGWSLMGDAIDYNRWKFGTRDEGIVYSMHSFFRKLAQGLAPSLVLVIMVAMGYVEANQGAQSAEVAMNMRYLVAGLYLTSALIQLVGVGLIYNLDKKTLAGMRAELDLRDR